MPGLQAFPSSTCGGDYLCIVTIALGEIVLLVLINNPGGLTGGPNGVVGIDRPRIFAHVIRTPMDFYFLVWVLVALCALALRHLQRSRIGRAWNYIREDELAAETMGVNVRTLKLLALVLGASLRWTCGKRSRGKNAHGLPGQLHFYGIVLDVLYRPFGRNGFLSPGPSSARP